MTSAELKSLQVQQSKLVEEKSNISEKIKNLQLTLKHLKENLNNLTQQEANLNKKIKKLTEKSNVVVSEHALLRYLERIHGLDLEQFKAEMFGVNNIDEISLPESSMHLKMNGYTLVIDDKVVKTVLEN